MSSVSSCVIRHAAAPEPWRSFRGKDGPRRAAAFEIRGVRARRSLDAVHRFRFGPHLPSPAGWPYTRPVVLTSSAFADPEAELSGEPVCCQPKPKSKVLQVALGRFASRTGEGVRDYSEFMPKRSAAAEWPRSSRPPRRGQITGERDMNVEVLAKDAVAACKALRAHPLSIPSVSLWGYSTVRCSRARASMPSPAFLLLTGASG